MMHTSPHILSFCNNFSFWSLWFRTSDSELMHRSLSILTHHLKNCLVFSFLSCFFSILFRHISKEYKLKHRTLSITSPSSIEFLSLSLISASSPFFLSLPSFEASSSFWSSMSSVSFLLLEFHPLFFPILLFPYSLKNHPFFQSANQKVSLSKLTFQFQLLP